MTVESSPIELHSSPHFKGAATVDRIMLDVVYALCPITLFAVYQFGLSALCLVITCTATCVLTEYGICRASGRPASVRDFSAVITGMLLALTLPPGFPLWMAAVGSVISIALGKALFGGIGFNVFNPALVGRAFLQAAFPVAITTWTPGQAAERLTQFIPSSLALPFMTPAPVADWVAEMSVDGFSGATPLALQKFDQIATDATTLFMGMTSGSAGETSALLILVCGAYLVYRNVVDWRLPAAMLLGAFITSGLFYLANSEAYPSPFFTLFAGGLMLGAVFMASDMVASPVTPLGIWIYAGLMGFLTVIIRLKGGLPEGVMYAILLGNAVSPIIDNLTQPRIFGARKKKEEAPS